MKRFRESIEPPVRGPGPDRKAERAAELAQCGADIQALLDQHDATFDVIIQVVYRGGAAQHTPLVTVVSK